MCLLLVINLFQFQFSSESMYRAVCIRKDVRKFSAVRLCRLTRSYVIFGSVLTWSWTHLSPLLFQLVLSLNESKKALFCSTSTGTENQLNTFQLFDPTFMKLNNLGLLHASTCNSLSFKLHACLQYRRKRCEWLPNYKNIDKNNEKLVCNVISTSNFGRRWRQRSKLLCRADKEAFSLFSCWRFSCLLSTPQHFHFW